MESKIKELNKRIEALNKKLMAEYSRLAEKYGFSIQKHKIKFLKKFRQRNREFRIPTWKYIIPRHIRHFVSMPFIYMMIIPTVILDMFVTVYHTVAFSLYRIPKVRRADFIIFDRQFLDYLNIIQKFHCVYCSYVNGVFAYALEIAARTERYWCPVKAAQKPKFHHGWYTEFADYGNPKEWKEKFNNPDAFCDIK